MKCYTEEVRAKHAKCTSPKCSVTFKPRSQEDATNQQGSSKESIKVKSQVAHEACPQAHTGSAMAFHVVQLPASSLINVPFFSLTYHGKLFRQFMGSEIHDRRGPGFPGSLQKEAFSDPAWVLPHPGQSGLRPPGDKGWDLVHLEIEMGLPLFGRLGPLI
jgi:hypothetical protein